MVTGDQPICLDCSTDLPLTNFWLHAGNPVEKIFWGRLRIEAAASMLYFTKRSIIQNLLHELKYRGNKEVGRLLGIVLRPGKEKRIQPGRRDMRWHGRNNEQTGTEECNDEKNENGYTNTQEQGRTVDQHTR